MSQKLVTQIQNYMHDYIAPGINEKTHQWILKCSSGAFTVYGERTSFSFFFFLLFFVLLLILYHLLTSPYYILPPFSLSSLSARSLHPLCSKEACHLFLWKQQLIATGGHHCDPIKTTRTKKKQSERKIKRQHCKLCFVMFVHANAMLWRNRGLLIDSVSHATD